MSYEPGDYVKVDFPDEATAIGEWMWVRVTRSDDEKQIVIGDPGQRTVRRISKTVEHSGPKSL
jgi:hypothetical protein